MLTLFNLFENRWIFKGVFLTFLIVAKVFGNFFPKYFFFSFFFCGFVVKKLIYLGQRGEFFFNLESISFKRIKKNRVSFFQRGQGLFCQKIRFFPPKFLKNKIGAKTLIVPWKPGFFSTHLGLFFFFRGE